MCDIGRRTAPRAEPGQARQCSFHSRRRTHGRKLGAVKMTHKFFTLPPLLLTSLAVILLPVALARAAAPASKRPQNILFIVSDDMRPWLGCYGHPQAKTPNLDKLAASGVRFRSAHVQYALCMPSRTSMLSGCRPDEAGRQWYIGPGRAGPQVPHSVSIRALRPGIVSLPERVAHHQHRQDRPRLGHGRFQ
jgi:hypothetical protein